MHYRKSVQCTKLDGCVCVCVCEVLGGESSAVVPTTRCRPTSRTVTLDGWFKSQVFASRMGDEPPLLSLPPLHARLRSKGDYELYPGKPNKQS